MPPHAVMQKRNNIAESAGLRQATDLIYKQNQMQGVMNNSYVAVEPTSSLST